MFWTEQRITARASQSEQRKSTLLSAVFSSVLLGTYTALVPLGWLVFFGHFLSLFQHIPANINITAQLMEISLPPPLL